MTIYVNEESISVATSVSLRDFLETHLSSCDGIAVAIEQTIIKKRKWSTHLLKDEQHLTIIKATQGG